MPLRFGSVARHAVDHHGARVGREKARDDVHQRGLAAARGPDDGDELAVAARRS